jgi:ABC-type glycerol-3-phosphate transport system substrate-binding protein
MPERLPDAAIVDSRELDDLQELGLLHSVQRDLPSGAYWDLFPPAQEIARRDGEWNNQPLTLETEHLVYDGGLPTTPPVSWQQVITDSTQFAFAADSTETFLFHYLQNGGSLDPGEHPALDAGVMQAILDYYRRARESGDLSENMVVIKSAREIMPLFVTAQVRMAQVRTRDFLPERIRLPNARAASIPTLDGRPTALVSGWSFVILTEDEAKHAAAVEYLEWLIDPARMGQWAEAADVVPAGKGAFAQALDSPEYADVLWALLHNAIVAPSFAKQQPYADAWHNAVEAVFNGLLTPDDAAFRAVQAITQ